MDPAMYAAKSIVKTLFGLYKKGATHASNTYIPLKTIFILTNIINSIAIMSIEQVYVNNQLSPIETEYIFPLESDMAVNSLTIYSGDNIIEAKVEEIHRANEIYEEAIAKGDTAYKLQYEEKQQDLLRMNAGNMQPGQEIKVKIVVAKKLEIEDLSWAFRLPTAYTPRYESPYSDKACGENLNSQTFAPAGSAESPYTWDIKFNITTSSPITRLVSKTHQIDIKFSNGNKNALVTLKSLNYLRGDKVDKTDATGEDFVLLYRDAQLGKPQVLFQNLDKHPETVAAFISFFPQFNNIENTGASGNQVVDTDPSVSYYERFKGADIDQNSAAEYIFLLDRSGSMSGARIEKAKEGLKEFIKLLPDKSKFNIVSFGSYYSYLFKESVLHTKENVIQTLNKISSFGADMGGTEIKGAIESIFSKERDTNYPTIMFILTDGDVSDTERVLQVIRDNKNYIQVHTFGVGSAASRYFVTEAATIAKGNYYFISDEESVSGKIVEALGKAIKPSLTGFKVTFEGQDSTVVLHQSPNLKNTPYIFENDAMNVFMLLDKSKIKENGKISITFYDTKTERPGVFELGYSIAENHISYDNEQDDLYKLVSRHIILQSMSDNDSELEKLISLKYQMLSSKTAFIGVEKNEVHSRKPMIVEKVPVVTPKSQQESLSADARAQYKKAARSFSPDKSASGGNAHNTVLESLQTYGYYYYGQDAQPYARQDSQPYARQDSQPYARQDSQPSYPKQNYQPSQPKQDLRQASLKKDYQPSPSNQDHQSSYRSAGMILNVAQLCMLLCWLLAILV